MTGPQLKAQRQTAGVTAVGLAVRMGVGAPRVSQIEAQASVSEATTTRYLAALIALAAEQRAVTQVGQSA